MSYRLQLIRRIVELPFMLQPGEPISQSELAEAFGVHPITIRRLMIVMMEYYPIYRIKEGKYVFYRWEDKPQKRKRAQS